MDNDFGPLDDGHQHPNHQPQMHQQMNGGDAMLYPTTIGQSSIGVVAASAVDSLSNVNNRSPLQLRQSSPFPMESTNSRRIHYVNPQERLRSSGKFFFSLYIKENEQ